MKTDRFDYYNQELEHLRKLAAEFSKAYPNIAGRDGLDSTDPHSARFIDAVALLNADVHRKLDEDMPELQRALMNVIYPIFQTPIPSMSIVQLLPKSALAQKTEIPKGVSIHTDPAYGESCTFTTSYPVTLWPIHVSQASLSGNTLQLTLMCSESTTFDNLRPERLRFFINAPREYSYLTYEWLMSHTVNLSVDDTPLDKRCLQPVGFTQSEGLLPYSLQTFMGYRRLCRNSLRRTE